MREAFLIVSLEVGEEGASTLLKKQTHLYKTGTKALVILLLCLV
jgi:hypothetical protein